MCHSAECSREFHSATVEISRISITWRRRFQKLNYLSMLSITRLGWSFDLVSLSLFFNLMYICFPFSPAWTSPVLVHTGWHAQEILQGMQITHVVLSLRSKKKRIIITIWTKRNKQEGHVFCFVAVIFKWVVVRASPHVTNGNKDWN